MSRNSPLIIINFKIIISLILVYYIITEILIIMTNENNLEKSSQDYKKSQYGSWYKKSAENKKNIDKEEDSFFKKFLNLFKK